MKIVIIGCTHAGTAAAINSAKLYKDAEITIYERNDNVSFLSCGIALHVEGVVKDPKGLFYSSPEELENIGVTTKMKHSVEKVDIKNKKLIVKDLKTGKEFEDNYDKLIITTGSWPIIPNIEGINLENILLSKNYYHAQNIINKMRNVKKIVVVGAGYIGIELVEAFRKNGKDVVLIDVEDRILSKYLDKEFTDIAEKSLKEHGIKLALGEKVIKFEGEDNKVKKVITTKNEYETDLVILSIGFKPSTELFSNQLKMLENGAIIVNEYMETSETDVFAAGDCCAVYYNPTKEYRYIPLATNAIRMGTIAAHNLKEKRLKHLGTQGTSGIKIYENNIASTGLTEFAAKIQGINVDSITITENNRPEFMPSYENLKLKVVFEKDDGKILGAQIISKANLTQAINTMSVIIQNNMKMNELAFIDFFFQPHYGKPWNFLNVAGLEYINKM
ncbi:NAD(FAD)-dependent dehydrogenase [Marinitoga piezophila KA3]|uniref:NAD(FAD)-dependent dehydrogenase n=1 Tax=Marinitoga piezophila (strain DSM 14283 / JCM 11233 / KA3) TaxID=443254 RepID=H2J832_MARPK|nr:MULTISPECIES: FAD-dependent oxidoreductase [Marinitoga]AEX85523.1 NAD(FAD)-dependent dehydrogenase [Marinitoga piezophila KA3]APT75989.1 NADH oxidase [Marinitoga sp. 1137]